MEVGVEHSHGGIEGESGGLSIVMAGWRVEERR